MSTQSPGPQYDYDGHIMRTPDEWCRIHDIQITDPDGWRGIGAKDWSEPLTELDFMERANVSTQSGHGSPKTTAAMTPGPAADLIEHAAGIIAAARKQPHSAPAHWAAALWEAGMLVAPGMAGVPTKARIRQQVAEEIAVTSPDQYEAPDWSPEQIAEARRIRTGRELGRQSRPGTE
jgi:hypothetical protein